MRRILITLMALLAAVAFIAPSADAASPHFKKGGSPTCTVTGGTTTCTGTLAGLGNGDVTINVTTSGSAVYQCQNQGGNIAPGQNKVLVGPSTTTDVIPNSAIKNGNLTFNTTPNTLTAPDEVSGETAGCPNSNWKGVNPTVTVTDITLTISQGGAVLFTCTASNPNGLSGRVPLSC
jgi:hypothetical protein